MSSNLNRIYTGTLRAVVMLLAGVTGVCIVAMVLLTSTDVIMRIFGRPIIGVFDLVRVFGAVGMAAALPYTTAVNAHIAIEYFVQKLHGMAKTVVTIIVHMLGIGLFSMLSQRFTTMLVTALRKRVLSSLRKPLPLKSVKRV